ncbi:ubiquitin carboxyl-terminal hydrolase 16 isoform X2 [Sesamum indicum]|uniref:ubiquitinyl hydrolase 1 n=1 Tax=Sesamum indicum TaxID=4182 RepID=A0A8M8UWF1_SESIN|nr:ubiquitin carboxyl-terminal hydrolase 16 isoform X2 [Sesamum indicum]
MLLVGDLRFLCSLVVVVVGWFLARWKWRRWVARNAEIRRRMALAREESDRIELEAAAGYSSYGPVLAAEPLADELVVGLGRSPGRSPPQHQCEVCFSPTTTRCKQCKAVRYCSRKCQTIHWLQGHKEECHSFTTYQNIDKGVHSYSKEFKQDGIQSSQNYIEIEGTRTTESVESSSGEQTFSSPILNLPSKNNESEKETTQVWKRTDINGKALVNSLPDECYSSTSSTDMSVASDSNLNDSNRSEGQSTFTNVESMSPFLSQQPRMTNPKYGRTAAGSQHSLPEMSTSSSDFWGGTLEPIRSKTDGLDKFGEVNMSNSGSSSTPSSGEINVHVKVLGADMNRVREDDTCPVTSVPEASTLSEVCEEGLKFSGPLSLSGNSECSAKEEAQLSSSDACQAHISEEHVPSKHAINISSLQSSACKQLDHETDLTNGVLDAKKCQQNDSVRLRSSDAHLSSSTCIRKPAVLNVKSIESECAHRDGACSLDSSGHLPCAKSGTDPSARRVMDQFRASNFTRHGTLGAENGITRYEGLFPYELFVKLYTWKERELCPSGLINCGNSCYANAILQCLTFTPPLTAYFLQGFHEKACQKKEWCFTCEFEMLVKKAKEGKFPVSPSRIMSHMQHIGSHMGSGKQEDAHEFLRCAIDAMQFVCLKEAGVHVAGGSLDEETTLLGLTFGGYLQSKIECMGCGGTFKQHERIMDLTVEIGGEIETLEDSLSLFTRSEMLDGENKYHCRRCNSYEQAEKKLRVSEAPNVLTIALKRFQLGTFGKLNKAVKFPEVLNLAPYMSGTSDKCPIYQLYGIVVHLDVMNSAVSGHYVCYIKNNEGRWFKADDSMVRAVDLENVLSQEAYMLFYARCSPRAPRLIRSSIIPRDTRKAKTPSLKFKSHAAEWDVSVRTKPCNHRSHQSHHPTRSKSEDDISSSSSESTSSFFSEVASHSTESSRSESSSTNDSFDQILGETGNFWNNTPSPSSSPFTLHSRHSPLGDLDRYSSDAETGSSCSIII